MTCLSIKILTLHDRPDKYLSIDQNSHDLIRIPNVVWACHSERPEGVKNLSLSEI